MGSGNACNRPGFDLQRADTQAAAREFAECRTRRHHIVEQRDAQATDLRIDDERLGDIASARDGGHADLIVSASYPPSPVRFDTQAGDAVQGARELDALVVAAPTRSEEHTSELQSLMRH